MGEVRNAYKILVGKFEGKKHLEDVNVNGRIILKWNLNLSQDRDQWRALVNKVINLLVS
jgi:hypothetical protein